MIRTHRPRGYQWSAATEFQQTELFRDISFDEAEAVDEEQLLSDSEDDFPLSDRIPKRRRIEKLADDFLNGEELHVLSARSEDGLIWTQNLESAVRNDIFDAQWSQDDESTWQDVEDDWECLRNRQVEKENIDPMYLDLKAVNDSISTEEILVEVHQSSCQRRRSRRIAKIAFGPSEDALRRAAELRNRKLKGAAVSTADQELQHSCPRKVVQDSQLEPESTGPADQDSLSDCGPSPTPAWTSAMWRSKGAFRPPRRPRPVLKPVDQDCSRDELGLSSFSIPSQAARVTHTERYLAERATGTQDSQGPAVTALISSADSVSSPASESKETNHRKDAMSTIEEQSNDHYDTATEHVIPDDSALNSQLDAQDDSQDRLLKQQGILARPRKSWATMNEQHRPSSTASHDVDLAAEDEIVVMPRTRVSILASAESSARKPRKPRSTKSAGGTPIAAVGQPRRRSNRRKSAPSESQKALEELHSLPADQQNSMSVMRMQYTESVTGKDSSPFVYRKRVSKFDNSDEPDVDRIEAQTVPAAAAKHVKTPRRPVKLASDTPLQSEDPQTPLTNEHLNQRLPDRMALGRNSASLRSSLRQEMIASGAEMSRAQSQKSSLPQGRASEEDMAEKTVVEESFLGGEGVENQESNVDIVADLPQQDPDPPPLWPGTQAMLAQAQHELFTSLDKTDSALYLGDQSTPRIQAEERERRPLGALSQEPVPSTQALLQNWQGWSSIKKPRHQPDARAMIAPSPTATKGKPRTQLAQSESFDEKARRRSSLRFSMSFSQNSPDQFVHVQSSSMPARSMDLVSALAQPEKSQDWPRPSGKIASSASFESGLSSLGLLAPAAKTLSVTAADEVVRDSFTHVPRLVDATTVSLSFGVSEQALAEDKQSDEALVPAARNVVPTSSPKATSTWRSPQPVEVSRPLVAEEESLITDLSFGPPDVQGGNEEEPIPSYMMYEEAQRLSQYDSQELRSTMNELVDDVLGTATIFSF
ncbi:hypothetical protein Slin15195_G102180 [Septoria linicola]|uniref:Uncharacterized protein n=1 Tax=Septoria linicola TaxID=215465 RepID=A0A9Q9AWU7_9PEZI|nr:hypothetical protein Slin14017_G065180 [Septoria linicola]USW56899.1 hypothetical protein Slin15195_G102180 [Septoria linicola]